ncbi:MAG: hypothetical protein AABY27_02785 [Pseudomonadota bacterium]
MSQIKKLKERLAQVETKANELADEVTNAMKQLPRSNEKAGLFEGKLKKEQKDLSKHKQRL